MNPTEKARQLGSMLRQVAPTEDVTEIPRRPVQAEEMAGASAFEAMEAVPGDDHVESALRKVNEGREEELTPAERFGLEAIVLPQNRPVMFIHGGTYDSCEEPWTHLNEQSVRARLSPLLPSIGRVELPTNSFIPYGGTAFVVAPNLLMTNRHVARLFTEGVGLGQRLVYQPGNAGVNFKREDRLENDESASVIVRSVEMIHPYWDMALLRVEGLPASAQPLTLSVRPPEELADRDVVAVGYPARDDRNDLAVQDRIFSRKYNVKRFQPGLLRSRASIQSFEQRVNAVTHDSSTLGGNSGSAIIDVKTGEVVGLHFAGVYLKANYAVPAYELSRDGRVVDRGVNFRKPVPPPTRDWDSAWARAGADERPGDGGIAANQSPPPPAPPAQPPTVWASAAGYGTASWIIPLQVSVSLGGLAPMDAARRESIGPRVECTAADATEAPRMMVPVIFDGLESREGYQPDFLELGRQNVPLPNLTARGKSVAAKLEDGSTELKYHKFSIVMHKARRLALFTAANVNWIPESRRIDGHKPTRGELTGLPEGVAEQWEMDWRIPEEHQLPDLFFTKDDGAFDKGHLVRRDDVAWGRTFRDMQKANGDTYHTTNCSPQVKQFNQSPQGEDNWGDLETLIQQQTKAEKACLFCGPVLAEDDPQFRGRVVTGGATTLIRIPRSFWKIVVVGDEDTGPQAFGFLLEQDLDNVPLEFAVPAAWRRHMRPIKEIEALLGGLADFAFLKKHDQFETDEGQRLNESVRASSFIPRGGGGNRRR